MARRAYSDPPYLGCAKTHYSDHPDHAIWDDPETHRQHIVELCDTYDSWALSMATTNLHDLVPMLPRDVRFGAWVKPFASYKPGVNPGYCWEPVVFWHPRAKRDRREPTIRDFTWPAIQDPCVAANITLKKGLAGAKPRAFCLWMFDLLGLELDDEFVDIFPGSGAVEEAYGWWRRSKRQSMKASA